jgi:hypothetical protein
MASYPQIVEYNEVIQHPTTAFLDAELQRGRVKENALGLPVVLSGGFALTYMITTTQRQIAVRCFHRQIPAADQKYAAISQKMQALNSKYFVGFDYLKQGIKVRQAVYPIVKMAWVEGDPLGIWLDKNSSNSALVEKSRAGFAALAGFLHQYGIAHGDIQNGNVMMSPTGITLIDYDGMYVPGMPLGNGSETGHKHFQHPGREALHFGPNMDRFSFIALDLSLRAVTEDSSLYKRFREGGETIVFRANDFADPQNSEIFRILRRNPRLRVFAENFSSVCEADISAVPTLEDFLAGRKIPIARKPGTSRAADTGVAAPLPRAARYIGPYPVLSTDDYARVMQRVGQRIELIGRIHAVKHGVGRRGRGRGKPYVFVNFGHWRGNIVKLTIWSEGLAQLHDAPDDSWIGRWVSVVGLVDAPYSGKHYNFHYTHVGITIENPQQINVVPEREAKFRLGQNTVSPTHISMDAAGPSVTPSVAADRAQQSGYRAAVGRKDVINPQRGNGSPANRTTVNHITGKGAFTPTATPNRQARPQATTNQDILRGIRQVPITPPVQPSIQPGLCSASTRRAGTTSPSPAATPPSLFRRMLRLIGLSK